MDSLAYIQAYLSGLRKRVKKQINFKNLFFGLLPWCNKNVFLVIFLFCWRKYISSIHSILCLRKYNLRAFPSRFVDLQENTVRLPCLLNSGDSCESCWSSTLGNFLKNTYCLKRAIYSVELLPPLIGKIQESNLLCATLPPLIGKLILYKYQEDSGNISHFYFKKLLDILRVQ